jgi:hypothetical protein
MCQCAIERSQFVSTMRRGTSLSKVGTQYPKPGTPTGGPKPTFVVVGGFVDCREDDWTEFTKPPTSRAAKSWSERHSLKSALGPLPQDRVAGQSTKPATRAVIVSD